MLVVRPSSRSFSYADLSTFRLMPMGMTATCYLVALTRLAMLPCLKKREAASDFESREQAWSDIVKSLMAVGGITAVTASITAIRAGIVMYQSGSAKAMRVFLRAFRSKGLVWDVLFPTPGRIAALVGPGS